MKGNLTFRNFPKMVDLDAEFIGINSYDGNSKAAFEITEKINRKDFGLNFNAFEQTNFLALSQDIKLTDDLEFTA